MPTYEYKCEKCSYKFDAFQKITDASLSVCPKCSGKLKRLISCGAGFIFKGSGFYATDYRKSPKEKQESSPALQCPKAKEGCAGCDTKP